MSDPALAGASRKRWVVLALGMAAQGSTTLYTVGLAVLVPALRSEEHFSLSGAEVVVAAPTLGLMATLILWGALADRFGERWVMALGLAASGAVQLGELGAHSLFARAAYYVAAGAAGASVNAASGRVVIGWFRPSERGVAMGARQMSQPLGLALAGLVMPWLAQHFGIDAALMVPAASCLFVSVMVALFVTDPPRTERVAGEKPLSPYRQSTLWRIHGASMLLVVPQIGLAAIATAYLHDVHRWSPVSAGELFAVTQLVGAAVRLGVGRWSDRHGSRLGPMRQLAVLNCLVLFVFAGCALFAPALSPAALVAVLLVSASPNGLAFTAVAEIAGGAWAGRALGVQNTAQSTTGLFAPPLAGDLVGIVGYTSTFVLTASCALGAAFFVPVSKERRHREEMARRPLEPLVSEAASTEDH